MKTKKFKLHKSFIKTCLFYFIVYSLIILGLYAFLNFVVSSKLNSAFPTLDTLLEYQDALNNDEFEKIPLKKFKGCSFLILDDNFKTLYSTDKRVSNFPWREKIFLLNDYYSNSYYTVFTEKRRDEQEKQEIYYHIYLNSYDEKTSSVQISDSCTLDSKYNIVEGTLFSDKTQLSEQDFNLIKGVFLNKRDIVKYSYTTTTGQSRVLVFIAKEFNNKAYSTAVSSANSIWLLAIPVMAAIILIQALLFSRKIKRSISPLTTAMVSYSEGTLLDVNEDQIPREFEKAIKSFNTLVDKLEDTKKEKEQIYLNRQQMIAGVSHDLKTPLTVIQGYSKAFIDGIVPENKKDAYMNAIYSRAENASQLMDALFEYSKMEHPEYKAVLEKVDICEFSKEYLAEKYTDIETHNSKLKFDIPDEEIPLLIDKVLIKRLFDNLIENSLRYNKDGVTIFFSIFKKKDSVHFIVGDNGVGISEEMRQKLFEPFVTGDSSRATGGTGLGMAISKKIVELHSGTIDLVYPQKQGYNVEFEIIL